MNIEFNSVIALANLILTAIIGIVVSIYIWKKNRAYSRKEKLIEIYFDLTSSMNEYYRHHYYRFLNELRETLINRIHQNLEDSNVVNYKDITANLYREFSLERHKKDFINYNVRNPNYPLRLFTIYLSKSEFKKLKKDINNIGIKIKDYCNYNVFTKTNPMDFDSFDSEIKSVIKANKLRLITQDETELEFMNKIIYFEVQGPIKFPKDVIYNVNDKIVDFIMKM